MLTVDLFSIPGIAKKLNPEEIISLNRIFTDPVILETLELIENKREFLRNIGIVLLVVTLGMIALISWRFTDDNSILEILFSGFFDKIGDIIGLICSIGFIYSVLIGVWGIKKCFKQELINTIFPLFDTDFQYSKDNKYGFSVPILLGLNIVDQTTYSTQFQVKNIQINTEEYTGKIKRNSSQDHYFVSKVVFNSCKIPVNEEILISEDSTSLVKGFIITFCGLGGFLGFGILSNLIGFTIGVLLALCFVRIMSHILGGRGVQLENVEFEKLFDVHSKDQVTSRMILTPAFMDRMVTFSKNTGRSGYNFIFQSETLYIGRNLPDDYACISTRRNLHDNIKHLIQFYIDTKESILLIKELNLTYLSAQNINTNNK